MGYTHYWERPKELELDRFIQLSKDVNIIFEASKANRISLGDGLGNKPNPVANNEQILFNGLGNESYETFYLPRVFNPQKWMKPSDVGLYFQFCKTSHRPYDLTVMAVLIAYKYYFAEGIVTSDGNIFDWEPAMKMCNQLFGYGLDFILDTEITTDFTKVYGMQIIEVEDIPKTEDWEDVSNEN